MEGGIPEYKGDDEVVERMNLFRKIKASNEDTDTNELKSSERVRRTDIKTKNTLLKQKTATLPWFKNI